MNELIVHMADVWLVRSAFAEETAREKFPEVSLSLPALAHRPGSITAGPRLGRDKARNGSFRRAVHPLKTNSSRFIIGRSFESN